ncbi:hypothetical protein [Synechococcus sp. ROS8604]|uniref:hypothetical protein n=1 Tax=Synechococcus sp. ROS8604 TaxID=1442557 RepID=UPI0016472571|nr:hypothetical protein [Synechococcus sp. ROS8604]QNI88853.1 hypothetical protein SynROS8604_02223 [Synechococcus sp. ROS8604]
MPVPVTASINTNLMTAKDSCQKKLKDGFTKHYAVGFIKQDFSSISEFAEAISGTSDLNGPGFSFGEFSGGYRNGKSFIRSWGIGIDLDKITTIDGKQILWDECERRLPTTEQLLNSRIGPFIRLIYKSQTCPPDAGYIMGRIILTFEYPLDFNQAKAFGVYLHELLRQDFPAMDEAMLEDIGLLGGIDSKAIKDPVRWWAGLKSGRTPCYMNDDAGHVPASIIDSWVGIGSQSIRTYDNSVERIDRLELDEASLKVFDIVISKILNPSGFNSYGSVYSWVHAFVQQVSPRLDNAFIEWMERSPYRMDRIGNNPQGVLRSRGLDYANLGTLFRALEADKCDWFNQYYKLTGEYPPFKYSWNMDDTRDDDFVMQSHPAVAIEALAALGLK